jgi:hypothetical protein
MDEHLVSFSQLRRLSVIVSPVNVVIFSLAHAHGFSFSAQENFRGMVMLFLEC